MNKQIFTAICDQLEAEVPELKWIDWDEGQLNVSVDQRPALAFPCCLIDIQYTDCRDTNETEQIVSASIVLKLAFMKSGETNNKAPQLVRSRALEVFNVIDKVHDKLQGWTGDELFSPMSRKRANGQNRGGIKIYTVTYSTTFREG